MVVKTAYCLGLIDLPLLLRLITKIMFWFFFFIDVDVDDDEVLVTLIFEHDNG